MALPKHVGDMFNALEFPLETTGKALASTSEARENILSVGIKAHPDNTSTAYIGDQSSQPWPLAAGEAITINVSRMSLIHAKGTTGDRLIILVVRTTGEKSTPFGS